MRFRIAVDTGGTFTDVVASDERGRLLFDKALTTPDRVSEGILEAVTHVGAKLGERTEDLLKQTELFIYGTTQATNAILTNSTAKTALLTTEGFPDILALREGGKQDPFDFTKAFPDSYIPRHLTLEIPGRIGPEGQIIRELDEDCVRTQARSLHSLDCEAAAVALIWSIANPDHELAVGRILEQECPGLPYTLSHELNPIIREYRRASSAAIDASLKPVMQRHFEDFAEDLASAGFAGELLAITSVGGCLHVADMVKRPIYSVDSGPSMAPVAAQAYGSGEGVTRDIIVCDAGGTSFDVSLIQDQRISTTREKWLGPEWEGHLTGLSAVSVTSIGAGGGSIAWIDDGGLLRVGPQSSGATPGPACYGRGGRAPTVTDAAAVLNYLDPNYFLGGRLELDFGAASEAIETSVATPLSLGVDQAAYAILTVATESMVSAIREITVNDGIDPRECLVVAGGGAGGLNAVTIAQALGCPEILVPGAAGALSACGAQFADVVREFSATKAMTTSAFDFTAANSVLSDLGRQMEDFAKGLRLHGGLIGELRRQFFLEARYPFQSWEVEVELPGDRLNGPKDLEVVTERFHEAHERKFAVKQPGEALECQHWKGRLTAKFNRPALATSSNDIAPNLEVQRRDVYFEASGALSTPCYLASSLIPGTRLDGPAILQQATTTVVIPPQATGTVTTLGNYWIETGAPEPASIT